MVVFGQKWLYFCKIFVFGESGCIQAKVVVIGQKRLHLSESGSSRA